MTPEQIRQELQQQFGSQVVLLAEGSWQVDGDRFRLLVLLSDDQSWLRVLIPIVPAQEALPFAEILLAANFDSTAETRYAIHEGALWGVFQHAATSLTREDFLGAVQKLVSLQAAGLNDCFNQLVEARVRQIIRVAKMRGQSLETTLQTLDRFYEEGLMGDLNAGATAREETLTAWKYQLGRLWHEEP